MALADPVVVVFQMLSLLLGLPGFLFAFACLILKRAANRGSVFGFIDTILRFLIVMLPWGCALLAVSLLGFAAVGCSAEWNHAASGVILTMAAGSAGVMYRIARLRDAGQGWFYVPGFLSALISGWLFIATR